MDQSTVTQEGSPWTRKLSYSPQYPITCTFHFAQYPYMPPLITKFTISGAATFLSVTALPCLITDKRYTFLPDYRKRPPGSLPSEAQDLRTLSSQFLRALVASLYKQTRGSSTFQILLAFLQSVPPRHYTVVHPFRHSLEKH